MDLPSSQRADLDPYEKGLIKRSWDAPSVPRMGGGAWAVWGAFWSSTGGNSCVQKKHRVDGLLWTRRLTCPICWGNMGQGGRKGRGLPFLWHRNVGAKRPGNRPLDISRTRQTEATKKGLEVPRIESNHVQTHGCGSSHPFENRF